MDVLDLWKERGTPRLLLNDVWEMLNDFDRPVRGGPASRKLAKTEEFYAPACDVSETDKCYILSFDMPGINRDEISVEVNGNQLSISGERKKEEESDVNGTHRSERTFGRFQRTFTIPEGVNSEAVIANHDNGVLKVSVPKAEAKKSKKIEIGAGEKSFLKKLTHKQEAKTVNSK